MLSRLLRTWSPVVLGPLIRALIRSGVAPNHLTLAGLLLAFLAGGFVASGELALGALALFLSGLLDILDGELARQSDRATPFGAFLDSIADHYGDFAVYAGIAWYALKAGDALTVALTFVAMFGSIVGSQIRSRAGMMGIETRDVGFWTRGERLLVLVLGLATGYLVAAMALLALANNLSALQRLGYVTSRAMKPRAKP